MPLLVFGAMAWPFAALGQDAHMTWRVGVLETVAPALNVANFDALRAGLRDLGYIEGRNLVIEYRSADGHVDRFPSLARELVDTGVDVIVTRGTPAVIAAKIATSTLPVVMAASGDPLAGGVIAGLARPGGNVTGLSAFTNDLIGKRIELLREIYPQMARLGFLQDMANPIASSQWDALRVGAQSLRVDPILIDVRSGEELERAFAELRKQQVDALAVGNDTVTHANRQQIVELAARHRVPAVYFAREFVVAGGLMVYAVDYADLYRRAATFLDKIFKGAKPADLPVQQPTKFELLINMKTANALGLTVPQSLLARADEVIE